MKRSNGKTGGRMKRKFLFAVCFSIVFMLAGCGKQIPQEENTEITPPTTKGTEIPEPTAGLTIIGETESSVRIEDVIEEQVKKDVSVIPEVPENEDNTKEPESKSEYTYQFYEMVCVAETEHIYEVDHDGVYRLNFTEQYNQVIFALPEGINMALCDYVTVKAKSEYGHLAVKLYDENAYIDPWAPEVYVRYDCIGEGVCEFTLEPELVCDVWGIGLMSSDKVEDFSQYKAEAYSVTFHRKTGE